MVIHDTCPTTKPKSTGIIKYPLIRGKLRGIPVLSATLSGDSMSSCTSILSGEIYSTVPTRSEASCSIGVVIIGYTIDVVGVVGVAEAGAAVVVEVGIDNAGDVAAGEPEAAPIRCCNSSAILIVVLSIADLGR